jgi:hypothetical protein
MINEETPIQHLYAILQLIKQTNKRKHEDVTNRAFTYWFEINIERLLEQEQNCIIKEYNQGYLKAIEIYKNQIKKL